MNKLGKVAVIAALWLTGAVSQASGQRTWAGQDALLQPSAPAGPGHGEAAAREGTVAVGAPAHPDAYAQCLLRPDPAGATPYRVRAGLGGEQGAFLLFTGADERLAQVSLSDPRAATPERLVRDLAQLRGVPVQAWGAVPGLQAVTVVFEEPGAAFRAMSVLTDAHRKRASMWLWHDPPSGGGARALPALQDAIWRRLGTCTAAEQP